MSDAFASELSTARVLVVEGAASLQLLIQKVIAPRVAEVRVAADGAEGLAIWRAWQPDLVITDIAMPITDGLVMSQAIRAEDPDTQIIVVSDSSDTGHLRQALDIGVDRYVLKPLDAQLLADAVTKCLRDASRLRELRLARLAFESASEGMMVTDADARILAVNPAFSEISGYRADEAIGKTPAMFSSGEHGHEFYQHMRDTLISAGRWSGEVINRRKSGELFSEWLSIVAVSEPSGRVTRYVGLFSDITERKREEDHIRRLAHFDALTGLPNRILFGDRLRRMLSTLERRSGQMALLYLDLDRFKPVNDQYGHAFGDKVLIEVAKRMSACMRASDTLSRRGGDEFVALLESPDPKAAAALVSRKLIDAVAQPMLIDGHAIDVGVSIGVAIYPNDSDDAEGLLEAADNALYTAKQNGRGDFRFHRKEDQSIAQAHLTLDAALRRGREEQRFQLRFLPEIDLVSGRVSRIEMLLRFQHPELGLLDASRFVEQAEKLGLMPALGIDSLRETAELLARLDLRDIGVSIDLSARQLAALTDPAPILAALSSSGFSPGSVTFECPESALTSNAAGLRGLYALSRAGFKCSLDDFGVGYCSFALLQQLPLDALKIDLTFIEEIDRNPQSRELVAALLAFGRRLGLRTVAEGVNRPEQLQFLRANGCDAVQGFLFGKPLATTELDAYLKAKSWLQQL
ncbi:MAG: EAL domain-containing protein [Pseudomonadota bacterium]|nr:EAL domain-containing protein [Pseudomonadota bacterium]